MKNANQGEMKTNWKTKSVNPSAIKYMLNDPKIRPLLNATDLSVTMEKEINKLDNFPRVVDFNTRKRRYSERLSFIASFRSRSEALLSLTSFIAIYHFHKVT